MNKLNSRPRQALKIKNLNQVCFWYYTIGCPSELNPRAFIRREFRVSPFAMNLSSMGSHGIVGEK